MHCAARAAIGADPRLVASRHRRAESRERKVPGRCHAARRAHSTAGPALHLQRAAGQSPCFGAPRSRPRGTSSSAARFTASPAATSAARTSPIAARVRARSAHASIGRPSASRGDHQRFEHHGRFVVARLPVEATGQCPPGAAAEAHVAQQVCRGARPAQGRFGLDEAPLVGPDDSDADDRANAACVVVRGWALAMRRPFARRPRGAAGWPQAPAHARSARVPERSGRGRGRSRPAAPRRQQQGPSRRGPRARATHVPGDGPPTRAGRAPRAWRRDTAHRAAPGRRRVPQRLTPAARIRTPATIRAPGRRAPPAR